MAEWIGGSVELEPVLDRNAPHPTALREAMKHGEAPKKTSRNKMSMQERQQDSSLSLRSWNDWE